MSKSVSRLFLEKLRGKASLDEKQLRDIAGQMKKSDFADEQKLRQLIRTLSAISKTPITAEKEEQILKMFRDKQIDVNDVQSLKKLL